MSEPEGSRWPHVPYGGLGELTDEQLAEYVDYWRAQMEAYRLARALLTRDDPAAYRTGYSAWSCGKLLSSGVWEQKRRIGRG
jgi:hypothetical protein